MVPAVAYAGASAFGARSAMAQQPGAVDPETVRLRKQLALVLAGAAVGSLFVAQSRMGGAAVTRIAEGAALGSILAAVLAYSRTARTPASPPLTVKVGDLVTVRASHVAGLPAFVTLSPSALVMLRARHVTPEGIVGPIERYHDAGGPPDGTAFPRQDVEFSVRADHVTSVVGAAEIEPVPATGGGLFTAPVFHALQFAPQPAAPVTPAAVFHAPFMTSPPRYAPPAIDPAASAPVPPAPAASAPAASVRYLTGEQLAGDAVLAGTIRDVAERAAAMNAFYRDEWYPRTFGTRRPDIPAELRITSHYRSFLDQARIVAGFLHPRRPASGWTDDSLRAALVESLRLRSIPGFSRHHWGTDIDVVSGDHVDWAAGGRFVPIIPFTRDEAPRFGFENPYAAGRHPDPTRPHFEPEPWHLSYVPMSEPLRQHWLRTLQGPELEALYDRAASAVSDASGGDIPREMLRRLLPTFDLVSIVRNVVPASGTLGAKALAPTMAPTMDSRPAAAVTAPSSARYV